ncbi:STAS domain-containing protein [Embleya hyalina]|uniref:Anti-sigma factor antagonist n=1 Tax=Embleya hyalina TaxID=516124 RepID=A0A401YT43_9ACTN|nr:STAS domain-containing protein [Embleya hyalina]GCD97790.1 anti-sigma factor antagonist [Embleya hyalina]
MNSPTPVEFSVDVQSGDTRSLHLAIRGELEYDTGTAFTERVNAVLDTHLRRHGPALRHLHLDWEGLTAIDCGGLSVLIGLRRRTHAAGIALHLHRQPARLTRLLDVTGVGGYLTEATDTDGRGLSAGGDGGRSAPSP